MGGGFSARKTGVAATVANAVATKQALKRVRGAAVVRASQVADGGELAIVGGRVVVKDSDGNVIGMLGTTALGSTGLFVKRPGLDQKYSFWAYTDVSGKGFAAMFDRQGNYIITDDANSEQGVARPYVPIGSWTDNSAPTRVTTSTTWATLATLIGYKQHPKVTCQVLCKVDANTTGDLRIIDQDGNLVGDVQSYPAGAFVYRIIRGPLLGPHMQSISLNLQARVTSGTGTIGARGVSAVGVESAAF